MPSIPPIAKPIGTEEFISGQEYWEEVSADNLLIPSPCPNDTPGPVKRLRQLHRRVDSFEFVDAETTEALLRLGSSREPQLRFVRTFVEDCNAAAAAGESFSMSFGDVFFSSWPADSSLRRVSDKEDLMDGRRGGRLKEEGARGLGRRFAGLLIRRGRVGGCDEERRLCTAIGGVTLVVVALSCRSGSIAGEVAEVPELPVSEEVRRKETGGASSTNLTRLDEGFAFGPELEDLRERVC